MELNGLFENANLAVGFVRSSVDLGEKLRQLIKGSEKGGVSPVEVAELTLQLQNQLIGAQQAQMTVLNTLLDLKKQMIETDRRLELHSRYLPMETIGGAFVLVLKSSEARGEPHHYICPDCAEQGKRSFLQPSGTGKQCLPCDKFFAFGQPDNRVGLLKTGHDVLHPYADD